MSVVHKKLGRYHSKNVNYTFKDGNIVFVVMNGVKEIIPGPNGYFKDEELLWLDKTLTKYKNNKVVLLQHFPLIDSNRKGHNLYKKDEYMQILSKHDNVIAVISGHYHENMEEKEGDIYNIVTKNFSDNQYYKLITIDDETYEIYTHLIDTKDKFD